jgi:hypothetical protein
MGDAMEEEQGLATNDKRDTDSLAAESPAVVVVVVPFVVADSEAGAAARVVETITDLGGVVMTAIWFCCFFAGWRKACVCLAAVAADTFGTASKAAKIPPPASWPPRRRRFAVAVAVAVVIGGMNGPRRTPWANKSKSSLVRQ